MGVVNSSSCTLKCLFSFLLGTENQHSNQNKRKERKTFGGNTTHVSTCPSARQDPSPFSPQLTIHRPSTWPAPSSVSATVSSAPGCTPVASSGGSCTRRASSQRAKARGVSQRNTGSYTRVLRGDNVSVSVVSSIPAGAFSLCECVVCCCCSCSCSCWSCRSCCCCCAVGGGVLAAVEVEVEVEMGKVHRRRRVVT